MDNIRFLDENGTFTLNNPENVSGFYFPLASETGLKSAITPNLGGRQQTGSGVLSAGAGERGGPAQPPRHPEFLVRHGGWLLVGHGGVGGAGGGSLHPRAGREHLDRRPDVAESEPGVQAFRPPVGDYLLCSRSGECGDYGGQNHQYRGRFPEADLCSGRPHLRTECGQRAGPPERDLHAPSDPDHRAWGPGEARHVL